MILLSLSKLACNASIKVRAMMTIKFRGFATSALLLMLST
jgi:hypothetical protein